MSHRNIKQLFVLILLLVSVFASAQTQQGFVKTRGRMVNGKLVPGKGLSGATVSIKGRNAVQSQANGSFSFVIPSQSFLVSKVQKNGYQLVDADMTSRPFKYSANNPIYLVMETPEQLMEDLLEAQEKISSTLRQQLAKARQEIKRLKDENAISEEEYRQRMAKLLEDQENNQKLIADMAKEYAQIDYDQLDSLNRQISDAILNGELTRADSLLRGKGDIRSRDAEITRRQQAEAQRKNEIAREQEELATSEEGTRKLLEDFAADCYKYYNMFKLENRHDSAMYYIELRARRDTTNAEWQFDAAYYCGEQKQYQKAIPYYERALEICRRISSTNPQAYEPDLAGTLNNLASMYNDTQRFDESETLYKEALEIRRRLSAIDPQTYEPDLAWTLNVLAVLYKATLRLEESDTLYKESLEIYRRLSTNNPHAYNPKLARSLTGLASLHEATQRYEESEALYKESLEIYRRLSAANPQAYEPDLIKILNNLAILYKDTQRFEESVLMYNEVLEIRRRLSAANPQDYEPDLAATLCDFADLYISMEKFDECVQIYKEASEIYRRLSATDPLAYEPDLAMAHLNIGMLYVSQDQCVEAILSLEEALKLYRRIAQVNPEEYQWYQVSLDYLSQLYRAVGNYAEAYQINQELLPLLKSEYEANVNDLHIEYAQTLGSQSFYAIFMKQYAEAEQLSKKGLAVDSTQHWIASNLAAALLFQGKYAEAEKTYRQYKDELKDSFLDDFRQFAEAGVIPEEREEDVERTKRMLNE